MEEKLLLLAELPGLEAARKAIDARILFIKQQIELNGDTLIPRRILDSEDPSILGRDVLGRIKRKRTLSPEVIEKKRRLIAEARKVRLAKLKEEEQEPEAPPAPVEAPQKGKKQKVV